MKELMIDLQEKIAAGQASVLVTVVDSHGSTPRKRGAKMLVSQEGAIKGTIGGGRVEFTCQEKAKTLFETKANALEEYLLTPKEAAGLGMTCGGKIKLLFQYLPFDAPDLAEVVAEVLTSLTMGQQGYLLTALDLAAERPLAFVSPVKKIGLTTNIEETELKPNQLVNLAGAEFLVENLLPPEKVYIFGGGHVAQALAPVLSGLNFYTVVVDDRLEFLTPELFPTVQERKPIDFEKIGDTLTIGPDDFIVSLTRGHLFDLQVARQTLKTPAYYIGMMGSSHKVAVQKQRLKEAGFSAKEISRIFMPIGVKIQGETPAELAISIAAELIDQRGLKNQRGNL